MKIIANAQHTGTKGHAATCMEIAVQHAQKEEVAMVFMNQGINKIFNTIFPTNNRFDVTVILKTGAVKLFEVMSKTDKETILRTRAISVMDSFTEGMKGEIQILNISNILKEK